MEKLKLLSTSTILSMLLFSGCGPTQKTGEGENATQETDSTAISLTKAPASFDYPGAALKLIAPTGTLDTGNILSKFEVTNFELGIQTPDAAERGIANSGMGQHIHFIVNNEPYSAHYEPEFSKNFQEGNYVILAFLSRSYHESVKNDSSFVLTQVTVGSPADAPDFDPTAQHLFYSRPKGSYKGDGETKKLMLDFFLVNTSLSESGNKVRATINGQEFVITEWAPYYIEGLEKGEVTIGLELIDKEGNLIPGPYNTVERKVTLE